MDLSIHCLIVWVRIFGIFACCCSSLDHGYLKDWCHSVATLWVSVWNSTYHHFEMCCWMVLYPIVGKIHFLWPPIKPKMLLLLQIAQPVKAHNNCFCCFCHSFVCDNVIGSGVVGLDGHWWLRLPYFLKCHFYNYCFSSIEEQGFISALMMMTWLFWLSWWCCELDHCWGRMWYCLT